MIFRNATIADMEEMQSLYVNTIQTVCNKDYDTDQRNVWASGINNTQRWLDVMNDQYILLAIVENTIVGFCTLKGADYIDFFYVHKDFQRQGIADKMLAALETKAKELNAEILTSDISITAKPFFLKKGFEALAEQSNHRGNVVLINYKMRKFL
ncbi:MAG: GNAT family N-acetyltransferase [Bacteroidota bacterium]